MYWSGTHCKASGTINLSSPTSSITSIRIWIGDDPVPVWEEVHPVNELMQHATRTRWFDSTRFAPNQLLKVKMVATGNDGSTDTKYAECMVKNRVGGFDHSKFVAIPGGNGGLIWKNRMINPSHYMLYDTYQEGLGWTSSTVFQRLNTGTTVVYINSHGFSASSPLVKPGLMFNMHQTDSLSPQVLFARISDAAAPSPAWTQGRDSYEAFMQTVVGVGTLPPFNTTGNPPISLLWLDCCHCGCNDAFERALWPFFSVCFENLIKNHAVVAFKVSVFADASEAMAAYATGSFAIDNTIDQTVAHIVSRQRINVFDDVTGKKRLLDKNDFTVLGDKFTRMNGVYNGTNKVSPLGWYY